MALNPSQRDQTADASHPERSEGPNPGREAILGRIRSALQKPAPQPEFISHDLALFPPVGDLLERLQKELAASLVDCIVTTDAASSARAISDALATLPPGEVFVQDAPELRAAVQSCERPIRWSSEGAPAESSQATISLADMLVAATGSIVVSSACGGRSASIVAPCHIVFARTSQIVPDLDAAMELIYKSGMLNNSFISFQTGASRTGDIEKILVHGAHGPRKVILVLERD
jgi:L-lactate dehydrogenase complex protein LldG